MGKRLGYVPALDGVRGIAILLVLAYHFFGLSGGFYGVDVFFVLSGFLITTLLLDERDLTGSISLRAFYRRRARRLLPAVFAMTMFAAAIGAIGYSPGKDAVIAAAGLFYAANFVRAFAHPDPLNSTPVDHLWSLSQEEQFYAVWPLVLIGVLRRCVSERRIAVALLAAFVAVADYRIGLHLDGVSATRIYFGPDAHAGGLVIGCAVAFLRRGGLTVHMPAFVCSLMLIGWAAAVGRFTGNWLVFGLPIVEIAAGLIVLGSLGPAGRLLAIRPLTYLGELSYSLYVWHQLARWITGWRQPWIALALTVVMTLISYYLLEEPFRRRRRQGSHVGGLKQLPARRADVAA